MTMQGLYSVRFVGYPKGSTDRYGIEVYVADPDAEGGERLIHAETGANYTQMVGWGKGLAQRTIRGTVSQLPEPDRLVEEPSPPPEDVDSALDIVFGEIQSALPGSVFKVLRRTKREANLEMTGPVLGGPLRLAVSTNPKITEGRSAWWWEKGIDDLKNIDLVFVFYGEATKPGEVWEASSGNPFKTDYRRIIRGGDVRLSRNGQNGPKSLEEPLTLMTRDNLRRFLRSQLISRKQHG